MTWTCCIQLHLLRPKHYVWSGKTAKMRTSLSTWRWRIILKWMWQKQECGDVNRADMAQNTRLPVCCKHSDEPCEFQKFREFYEFQKFVEFSEFQKCREFNEFQKCQGILWVPKNPGIWWVPKIQEFCEFQQIPGILWVPKIPGMCDVSTATTSLAPRTVHHEGNGFLYYTVRNSDYTRYSKPSRHFPAYTQCCRHKPHSPVTWTLSKCGRASDYVATQSGHCTSHLQRSAPHSNCPRHRRVCSTWDAVWHLRSQ